MARHAVLHALIAARGWVAADLFGPFKGRVPGAKITHSLSRGMLAIDSESYQSMPGFGRRVPPREGWNIGGGRLHLSVAGRAGNGTEHLTP